MGWRRAPHPPIDAQQLDAMLVRALLEVSVPKSAAVGEVAVGGVDSRTNAQCASARHSRKAEGGYVPSVQAAEVAEHHRGFGRRSVGWGARGPIGHQTAAQPCAHERASGERPTRRA